MTIPSELLAVLPEAGSATHHVHLRAGLDTLLGETHLAIVDGRLLVASRSSLLTPLERLAGVRGARLEAGNFREVLRIEHAKGSATVTLGFGDADAVKELLVALTDDEPFASVHDPDPISVEEPASDAASDEAAAVEAVATEPAVADDPEVIVAAASVREAPRSGASWEARMALAEEHERANRMTEALTALEAAAQARAPAEKVVPALVRVSRLLGDTRRLSVALRRSKKLTRDETARRAIDAEIRALVTDMVYDGPEAAGPKAPKRSKKRPPRAAQIAAPFHVKDPAASADDGDEDEKDESGASDESDASDDDATLGESVGEAAKRRARRKPEPLQPTTAKPEQAKPDVLLWALLIMLVGAGAGAALLRLLG